MADPDPTLTYYQGLPGRWAAPGSPEFGEEVAGRTAVFQVDPAYLQSIGGSQAEFAPAARNAFDDVPGEYASVVAMMRLDLLNEMVRTRPPAPCPAGGASSASGSDFYGDGSDGDVILYADTTLTRDMFYNNLALAAGVTLYPNGFQLYVRKQLTISAGAAIQAGGGAGGAGSGAAGGAAGTAGGATSSRPFLAQAGAGGAGGTSGGSGTTTGATAAGGVGEPRLVRAGPLTACAACGGGGGAYLGSSSGATNAAAGQSSLAADGGAGGAAVLGAGSSSLGGGGGGGGGGVIMIFARILGNEGAIRADGGAGGNGQTSGAHKSGNGGGGGGGAGIAYYTFTSGIGAGTLSASAGAAGTGGNGGAAGSAGRTQTVQVPL